MAEFVKVVAQMHAQGKSLADMVYGPLPPENEDTNAKWKDLSPEDQADILKDFRMAALIKACPDEPEKIAYRLAEERKIIDFTDPKVILLDSIYALKRGFIFKHNNPEFQKKISGDFYKGIEKQYKYLRECPIDEQFYTEDEREEYFEVVDRWIDQLGEIRKVWKRYEDEVERIVSLGAAEKVKEMRPQFFEELTGMPWKQFLDDEAPGWPADWANGPDVVEKQRIPNGGVRIAELWERQTADVYRDLDAARGDGVSAFKSGLAHAHNNAFTSPDGKKSKSLKVGVVGQSPFPELYADGRPLYDGDLFPLNQAISSLDGHRRAPDWKAATLQVKKVGSSTSQNQDSA